MKKLNYQPLSRKIWTAGSLTYTSAGVVVLFCWLLWGDFAWAMRDRAYWPVSTLMLKSFEASDFLVGIIMVSFVNFTNIFLGPIISYRSDRHRGKLGRRIPFLLFTTPFVMVGLIGLGFAPILGAYLQKLIGVQRISLNHSCLMVFCAFWVVLDFGMTLASSIFNALLNDVVPRVLMGRFMGLFRMVSLGTGILFNYFLIGQAETYMELILILLGVIYGAGMFAICWRVKEGEYPPVPPEDRMDKKFSYAFVNYFRESYRLPFYRWVMVSTIVPSMTALPVNMYALFYARSVGMELSCYGKITAAFCLLSMLISFPIGWLSDKFHPLRTGMVSLALLSVVMLIGGQIATTHNTFAVFYFLQNALVMTYNTATASYTQRLYPQSHYAQICSAGALVGAITAMLFAPCCGMLLDMTGSHYPHIFTIGGVFGLLGFGSMLIVYRYYLKLGGDSNYRAPEVS